VFASDDLSGKKLICEDYDGEYIDTITFFSKDSFSMHAYYMEGYDRFRGKGKYQTNSDSIFLEFCGYGIKKCNEKGNILYKVYRKTLYYGVTVTGIDEFSIRSKPCKVFSGSSIQLQNKAKKLIQKMKKQITKNNKI